MTLRVLVADDEPLVRERLRTLLAERRDCELVAECCDGDEAIRQVENVRPDLALLDVRMPGLDGFDVLDGIDPELRPLVIFVTAYDEHAVRAFEVHAIDYLLKPVDAARFGVAIDRAVAQHSHRGANDATSDALRELAQQVRALRGQEHRFVVRDGGRITFVAAADIDWIDAAGNYARLHANGSSYLLRETMKSIEARLDPDRFVRVHRSAIVNIERIVAMEPYFHGEYVLTLKDGRRLTSSRTHSARLRILLR